MKFDVFRVATLSLFTILIISCSSSTEPVTSGSLTFSTKYTKTALAKIGNLLAVDSIKITKATYLLREIKFKSQNDSTDGLYKTTPLVLELNLDGNVQEVASQNVPFGTYTRLEFDIHKAEANDTLSMSADQRTKIRPFFAGDKYSIIIEGIIYEGTTQRSFVYKSRLNVKQKIDLVQPIAVSGTEPAVNTTMLISSNGWFKENNSILDPSDSKNETKIDNNIRSSVRAYKDKNKDGIAD